MPSIASAAKPKCRQAPAKIRAEGKVSLLAL